jgi:hypothetical protein
VTEVKVESPLQEGRFGWVWPRIYPRSNF